MKLMFVILAALSLCACTTYKENDTVQEAKPADEQKAPIDKPVLGGWYPVFFDDFNKDEVDSIINSIADGRAKRITITYDKNKSLAEQIKAAIQKELNFAVEMNQVENKDTKNLKFDHKRVIVIVYQR